MATCTDDAVACVTVAALPSTDAKRTWAKRASDTDRYPTYKTAITADAHRELLQSNASPNVFTVYFMERTRPAMPRLVRA